MCKALRNQFEGVAADHGLSTLRVATDGCYSDPDVEAAWQLTLQHGGLPEYRRDGSVTLWSRPVPPAVANFALTERQRLLDEMAHLQGLLRRCREQLDPHRHATLRADIWAALT